MRKRIIISIIIFSIIFITLPFAIAFLNIEGIGIFTISSIVALVYVGVFIFGGLPELIIYGIYGLITTLLLYVIDYSYQLPIVIIMTIIFILNPLAQLESSLRSGMKDENTQPIRFSIRGKKWPFFAYRREMKNYYHLPQSRKLYTQTHYKMLRQLLMLVLIGLGIFVFIHEINHIANTLDNFNWTNFLTFYLIVIIFLLAYFLYLKGFTSTFRTFAFSLVPPLIYIIGITNSEFWIKFSVIAAIIFITLVLSVVELYHLYQRVVYAPLHYYDVEMQADVYANALFEPLVYNETYTLCAEFEIKTDEKTFNENFKSILVYANYFHFIIAAYTIDTQKVVLHVHFLYKNHRRIEKFKGFLESKFQRSIPVNVYSDYNKASYEKNFFHKDAYIIARALYLANLLRDLEIKSKVIISLIVYFENDQQYQMFTETQPATKLSEVSIDGYVSAKIDMICPNNDFMIEKNLRETLLNLLIFQGKFVRLNVFY